MSFALELSQNPKRVGAASSSNFDLVNQARTRRSTNGPVQMLRGPQVVAAEPNVLLEIVV